MRDGWWDAPEAGPVPTPEAAGRARPWTGARAPWKAPRPRPGPERDAAAKRRSRRGALACGAALLLGAVPVAAAPVAALDRLPRRDVHALFAAAEAAGRVGVARRTKPVDARPARPGEVVVTRIAGVGRETRSKPAADGDRVVRNRCPATGNEEYLVRAQTFAGRYEGPLPGPDGGGWREVRPRGPRMRFFVLTEAGGSFRFAAPWGEPMRAGPADAILRDPAEPRDTYQVAAAAFACTHEAVAPPRRP